MRIRHDLQQTGDSARVELSPSGGAKSLTEEPLNVHVTRALRRQRVRRKLTRVGLPPGGVPAYHWSTKQSPGRRPLGASERIDATSGLPNYVAYKDTASAPYKWAWDLHLDAVQGSMTLIVTDLIGATHLLKEGNKHLD